MSLTKISSVLFVGVTGPYSFGQIVVSHIATQLHNFSRVAIYHDTSRPTDERKQALLSRYHDLGVEIVASDGYSSPTPFTGFDTVLIFLGNHALHLQPHIIDLAIEAGVRHFYPSEYGADILVGENRTQRYYKYKVAAREHLDARGKEIKDLSWTYFLLGRLTEWSVLSHFGFDNRTFSARIYGTPEGRQSLLAVDDAAEYIVATLKVALAAEKQERTFRISGSSPTYAEIFDILGRIRGKEYEVTYLDVESAIDEEREAKAKGDVDGELAASHKLIQGRQGTLLPEPWDNEMFPSVGENTSVEEALRRAFGAEKWKWAYGLTD